jgi:ribosomal protein S13
MSKNKSISFLKKFVQTNYGVNTSMGEKVFRNLGINVRINASTLKRKQQAEISRKFSLITSGKKLKDKIKTTINFLSKNKTYKGIRHKLRYPARGQRTHTNAKTKKKFKF